MSDEYQGFVKNYKNLHWIHINIRNINYGFEAINHSYRNKIEYDKENKLLFKDQKLMEEFMNYHKEKANLRALKKEKNSGRTGMARVKQSIKDLKIE